MQSGELSSSIKAKITDLTAPIKDDLLSGAAEIALRAITVYQTALKIQDDASLNLSASERADGDLLKEIIAQTASALIDVQPAMAPLTAMGNIVLQAIDLEQSKEAIIEKANQALTRFESTLCASAATIADIAYDLIDPGELIFAYSFSSTVVSCLLNARARGRYFRVVCTEARPSMEGRKLASRLTSGGIEVIHTFDSALGLVLGNCSAAFMGVDCITRAGVVNKVGSWMLAVACRELKVPLYALSGTEKFISDDRMFDFEKHERPGSEVWEGAPKGVAVLNHQFDLVPFELLTGLVTENGILKEKDLEPYFSDSNAGVHKALKLS